MEDFRQTKRQEPSIEKDVPFKTKYVGGATDLLEKMGIGDSVYFEDLDGTTIRNRYYNSAKRLGIEVRVRKWNNGYRMRRIG